MARKANYKQRKLIFQFTSIPQFKLQGEVTSLKDLRGVAFSFLAEELTS